MSIILDRSAIAEKMKGAIIMITLVKLGMSKPIFETCETKNEVLDKVLQTDAAYEQTRIFNADDQCYTVFTAPKSNGPVNVVATALTNKHVNGDAYLVACEGDKFVDMGMRLTLMIGGFYAALLTAKTLKPGKAGIDYSIRSGIAGSKSIIHDMQIMIGKDPNEAISSAINDCARELLSGVTPNINDLWLYCLACDTLKDTFESRMDPFQRNRYHEIASNILMESVTFNVDTLKQQGGNKG